MQPADVVGVRGELGLAGRRVGREVLQVLDRRHQRGALRRHLLDEVARQSGAVLDAVDTGVDQVRQRRLAEDVRGDPYALGVRLGHRGLHRLARPRGREVTGLPFDPVADDLDPAVAALGLLRHVAGQLLGLDLVRVSADVAPGPGQVPAGADQLGKVRAVVDPAGVGGRAAVAQQQRSGRAVVERLLLLGGLVDRAVGVQSDVAVRVDESRHQPARAQVGGVGDRLVRDPAVGHVQVPVLPLGQHDPAYSQCLGHGGEPSGARVGPGGVLPRNPRFPRVTRRGKPGFPT